MDAEKLTDELLSMVVEDHRVRAKLVSDGSLFEGYHPLMQEIHERNAARLMVILENHGWPGRSLVGEKAAEAAWLILQHAIGNPTLQRLGLSLLKEAATKGEIPLIQVAMLEDRIRVNEGKRQRYGTQFDWDKNGQMSPLPIEDEGNVDMRRREIGLMPLAQDTQRKRDRAIMEGERPPQDWTARQCEIENWLRVTGWRE
jgi:hypothetical protein